MLSSKRANGFDIGEPYWPYLEVNPFMCKRVPDAPRVWIGRLPSCPDPLEEDQRHFYSEKKNTAEMVRMMNVLVDQYRDRRQSYLFLGCSFMARLERVEQEDR